MIPTVKHGVGGGVFRSVAFVGLKAALFLMPVEIMAEPKYSVRVGLNETKHLLTPEVATGKRVFGHGLHVSAAREFPWRFGALTIGVGYEQRNGAYEDDEVDEDGWRFKGEVATDLAYLTVPAGMQFENRNNPRGRAYLALRLVPSLIVHARESGMVRVWDENDNLVIANDASENAMNRTTPFDLVAEAELGYSLPLGIQRMGGKLRALAGMGVGYGLIDNYDPLDDPAPDREYSYHSLVVRLFVGTTF